ncbi:unnamed protein product [Rhizoctonia solani]|uniref:Zn(2)-C6 fungal-type domain-containing protein n=1 Tax=Rhizoctonia solani TaxID=456999 RepID=A0A8H3CVX5_9AGAM|nr:unnamed protein product [Rhizoctonia solani]
MSKIMVVPKRSMRGCLTCKRRKKKCDEQKPSCRRCIQGDFHCFGYDSSEISCAKGPSGNANTGLPHWSSYASVAPDLKESFDLTPLENLIPVPEHTIGTGSSSKLPTPVQRVKPSAPTIPNCLILDPLVLENATSLIMSQYLGLTRELLFKPPLTSLERGLLWRIEYSDFTRWSMYLGARVLHDISSGKNGQKYTGWIFRFCQRILESSTSTETEEAIEGQLGGLHDLAYLGFMVSGIAFGYSLFQRCTHTFLRLAALSPDLWSDNSTISISKALRRRYEASKFVAHDTIIACILGIPPLLHYDTTSPWGDEKSNRVLELVYGVPCETLYHFAKINAWRASRLMSEVAQSRSDWFDIEISLTNGSPAIDHTDEPVKDIARFAVQEIWRQSALIYFYMGVRGVNSADPRVEAAVQQVVQLGSTIEPGSALELHTLISCVIAGAAARQEKHRASIRSKVASRSFRREITLVLRVSEFTAVLDHLWHGAGIEGKPTTWEDYVQSRSSVLPIAC